MNKAISINQANIKPDILLSIIKPEPKVRAVTNGLMLSFDLHDIFDAINIYREMPGEETFNYLATDTRSPYIETGFMQPGTQYYCCYVLNGKETGKRSEIIKIKKSIIKYRSAVQRAPNSKNRWTEKLGQAIAYVLIFIDVLLNSTQV